MTADREKRRFKARVEPNAAVAFWRRDDRLVRVCPTSYWLSRRKVCLAGDLEPKSLDPLGELPQMSSG
jgi:hypothetical protein